MHKLNSQETTQVLNISDCELMHLRERGGIAYEKHGRAFFYSLPAGYSILDHPLGQSLLNWYKSKHDFLQSNEPIIGSSLLALEELVGEVLSIAAHFAKAVEGLFFSSHHILLVVCRIGKPLPALSFHKPFIPIP